MKQFSITAGINAAPERVFSVMTDIERWPEWTASVTRIEKLDPGLLRVGSRARITQPKLRPSVWQVIAIDEGRGFTWVTRAPGVLVTAHHFIEPTSAGCRVTLSIDYSGLLGALVARLTRTLNDRYLALEAKGLKERSEALTAAQ